MKKFLFCLLIYFSPCNSFAQKTAGLSWVQQWFDAWELMSKEFAIPSEPAPMMLFFDEEYVYTTMREAYPGAAPINGPGLLGEKLNWFKQLHHNVLNIQGENVPVGVMSFAAPVKNSIGKKFFVMGAPSFWKNAGVASAELGLNNLLTGVFLHEFAHTKQMEGFGMMVDHIEQSKIFENLDDDIVQNIFKTDSNYVNRFISEKEKFYAAAFEKNISRSRLLAQEALLLMDKRRQDYFVGDKKILNDLDDIFLSMEGLGQYIAVEWLIHPKGANLDESLAVSGFRRGKKQWSQEEGLAMFLVVKKHSTPGWLNSQFGKKPVSIVALLRQALSTK